MKTDKVEKRKQTRYECIKAIHNILSNINGFCTSTANLPVLLLNIEHLTGTFVLVSGNSPSRAE